MDGVRLAKILTVSDGVASGTRVDRSGDALAEKLVELGFLVVERRITPDGADEVANSLTEMAAGFHGLILSTGGTGFSMRDLTPEGTSMVLDRFAPGLSEAARAINPLGRLSRGVAGTKGEALIMNLPGSSNGAIESLLAVGDILGHAIDLISDSKSEHPNSPAPDQRG